MRWASALQWVPGSRQVTYAELALGFESHSNRALPARMGHRHARQVPSLRERARVLWEVADLLQPLFASKTLLEGRFRWTCASLVPLGAFAAWGARSGRCSRLGPTCGSKHMHWLQQHCPKLWTFRLSTLGSGRKDYFLAGYLPRRPGGVATARLYNIVRAQRPRAAGVARPRPPPSADVRPAPCRLCPVHPKPQCEQCRLARRGVAHSCARGHAGHPVAS